MNPESTNGARVPAPRRRWEAELALALDAAGDRGELYRPTAFWADATRAIADEVRAHGIERFRRLPVALGYFVPTYGVPGNGFTETSADALRLAVSNHPKRALAVEQLLSGHGAALADFRVLEAADDPAAGPPLHAFSEGRVGEPVEQFEFDGRRFSRSSLNYLLGLCLLKRHLDPGERVRSVVEIGGGFGSLGEILLSGGADDVRYVDLDIPPNSTIAEYYLAETLGAERVAGFSHVRDAASIDIDSLPPASALCNWQIEALRGEVDLFVNFISFQEMEPHVVGNYLRHVERLDARWILLRNMREGKQRRTPTSVGVEDPITSEDYLAMLPGYDAVARNVAPFGYRTVDGYHSELLLLRRRRDGRG